MVTLLSSNSRCDPENNPQNNETTGRFFKHLSFFKSSFKHSESMRSLSFAVATPTATFENLVSATRFVTKAKAREDMDNKEKVLVRIFLLR